MNVLISSCFLLPTRYDGTNQNKPKISQILDLLGQAEINLIPVCPEQLGGLSTPRRPAEISGDKVIDLSGHDVSSQFKLGASLSLVMAEVTNISFAILKENSPSCGSHQIYDGTHTGRLIDGQGLTTKLLTENGIIVFSENQIDQIKEYICKQKT